MQLRPYQSEGVDWLTRTPNALLAFDTRLGKSIVTLTAADQVGAKRVLILAPAIGRLSWATELDKAGLDLGHAWIVGQGEGPLPRLLALDRLVLVLAYDALSHDRHGWARALSDCKPWNVVVLDECQYLKSMGSNRTQAVYSQVRHNTARVWLLSGTPTPNHAGEIYPHVRALWPEILPGQGTRHEFEDRYCKVENTAWGRRITGSRNQSELRGLLAPHVMRRRKQDVFSDLPRVQHVHVPIELGKAPAPPGRSDNELEWLLRNALTAEGASIRRRLGEDKAPSAVAWLREQLDNSIMDKVVVFAWHRSVLDLLEAGLADLAPVRLDGSTSTADRNHAVRAFQSDPNCRVFLGQLVAAGTAINLDAADDVVIVEPSWVPMENYQAASRVENVGLRKAVTVSWLSAPGTLDGQIMASLRIKTAQISAIWD